MTREEAWVAFQAALEDVEDRIDELACARAVASVELDGGFRLFWQRKKEAWGLWIVGPEVNAPLNSAPNALRIAAVGKLGALVHAMREADVATVAEVMKMTKKLQEFEP